MLEDIKVVYFSKTNPNYDIEDTKKASRMLNDILNDFKLGRYKEGCRNNMAVDFTCLCHVLNLDPYKLSKEFLKNEADQYDIGQRIPVIETYLDTWDRSYDGVFSMMMYGCNDNYPEMYIEVKDDSE